MKKTGFASIAVAILALAACSSPSVEQYITAPYPAAGPGATAGGQLSSYPQIASSDPAGTQSTRRAMPRIVKGSPGLQCVPYTREQSGIPIRGDAWTWWGKSIGKYQRAKRPAVGAVLVVSRTRRNQYGHLAVVTRIVNDREIIVKHANWLNKGQIHLDTPVRDVSARNDWSVVRFWYTPGNVLGRTNYPVSGFIYPKETVAVNG